MGRSSTLARLALETGRAHAQIEEALLGPLDFPTTVGYRRFLCVFYGFQAPLESALTMTPGIDLDFVAMRAKAGRIASDLLSLGLTRHEHHLLARRQEIGPFENVAQAAGWMYSTERLMLQVDAMRFRIESEMPVVIQLANQFLYSCSNNADMRWRQYGVMLDRLAKQYDVEEIVASACQSVQSLHGWLTQQVVKPVANTDERITQQQRAIA
ncbi:MAG: biliverdin-producing heme oxygenase [Deltaproteobacteria bacterium]|nr:biliverdin-producing heme oxygenase [Deltaproteobacteria bacterium]